MIDNILNTPNPETATLPELCSRHMVGTFSLEMVASGEPLCFAFFHHDGELHLYQRGNNLSADTWYWTTALETDIASRRVATSLAQDMFSKRTTVSEGAA